MVEELAAILRLKQNLRDAAARLANEAEGHPDNRVALGAPEAERAIGFPMASAQAENDSA
jgi:hypothetical protein